MKEVRMNKIFDRYITPTRRAFFELEQMGETPDFVLEAKSIFERQVREMERLRNFLYAISNGQKYTLLELDQMIASFTSKSSTLSRARIAIIRGQKNNEFSSEAELLLSQIKKNILALKAIRDAQLERLNLLRDSLSPAIDLMGQLFSSF